jgi:hypothetical protein
LSYNLILYSGKRIRALRDKKKKYSNSCVVRKKNSERNKKNITSPFKLNGRPLSEINLLQKRQNRIYKEEGKTGESNTCNNQSNL